MVRSPVHVSVCPSPALELGWFGHMSVAPPAAPLLMFFSPGFSSFGICSDLGW